MRIGDRNIGRGLPPYIVAEISCNHGGHLSRAKELIQTAKLCGADAVKFQAYTPDTITLDSDKADFVIKAGPWAGCKLYELYRETHTPFEWFPELFACAAIQEITLFASVFDKSSVDMLERLGCQAYKIASPEITDLPLIKYAAATGKPVIISTGMASKADIARAWATAEPGQRLLLHCVSSYPTELRRSNLAGMKGKDGVSDHTPGIEIPIAAAALGAAMIEKHLEEGIYATEDSDFSMEPGGFEAMTKAVLAVWESVHKPQEVDESASSQFRRSLYAVADIKAGEPFTELNVRSIRPSYGLPPAALPDLMESVAAHDIERGTALSWGVVTRVPQNVA